MATSPARVLLAFMLGLAPALLGTVAAALYTGAGHVTLGRLAEVELNQRFRGQFQVGEVGGSFVRTLVISDLVIRDTLGQPFASVPRLAVRYTLPALAAGRFVFSEVVVESPVLRVVKRSSGRLNHQEIFRLGEGPDRTGAAPLVEFRNVRVRRAELELRLPWNPPDSARTPAAVAAALAADRARPGRLVLDTPDGLRRVVSLTAVNAHLDRILVSAPNRPPLTLDIDSLSARVSDPAIQVVDLAAHLWTRGDSLALTIHRARLPNTRANGGGVITWPEGPLQYDLTLDVPRLDLNDLHWVSPDFPALTGRALLTAESRSARVTAYHLQSLALQGPAGRLNGNVTVLQDADRGLGVEDMRLDLADLDLDVPRPYLDTLPLHGTLSGQLNGDGFLDRLELEFNLLFTDAAVPDGAYSRVHGLGRVMLGGAEGAVFDTLQLQTADLDLRTVTRLAPAVTLQGRLQLDGVLRGPWHDLTYQGRMTHSDGDLPRSEAEGTMTLDTRGEPLRFRVRLQLTPLAFDGIRPGYPGVVTQGTARGLLALDGSTERFHTSAALTGELGQVRWEGILARRPTGFAAESLSASFTELDVARVRGTGPRTRLTGSLLADGVIDSAAPPIGRLVLHLGPGQADRVPFDSLGLRLQAAGGLVTLDTLVLHWRGGALSGRGALRWEEPGPERIEASFAAESLAALDPLLELLAGPADTSLARVETTGRLRGVVALAGSARRPRLMASAHGTALVWRDVRMPSVAFGFGWNDAVRPEINLAILADTASLGGRLLTAVDVNAGGYADSLHWVARGAVGDGVGLAGAGSWWKLADTSQVQCDSLVARFPAGRWRLQQPVTITGREGRYDLTPLRLLAEDGGGEVRLNGSLPGSGPGQLEVGVLGLEVRQVYSLLGRDTAGVSGTVQVDLVLGGTAAGPTLRGTAAVADLSFGDFGAPFMQGVIDYADRSLEANLLLWKTGEPVLRVDARLPLDLALRHTSSRQVDGPLSVRILADSTDLGVAEAFTRNVRRVRGRLRADIAVGGSWEQPRLGGILQLLGASADLPGLGVRYDRINATAHLSGDSILVDSLAARGGEGTLRAAGTVRLDRLTRPVLDLTLRASRFRSIDVRRFLTLDASGTVRVTGPVFKAHLSGRVTANQGTLHFADLLTKRIVDLENPGDSGLIDLDLIRTEHLGADFQNRFLDSLTIDTLQIQMGEGFWLRSSEANIQLDGGLVVTKSRDRYRYDGTLNAARGNYALRIGSVVTRDFTVDHGTVRYFGTPDLNAALDIEARYTVLAAETNEAIPIIAKISGTMLQPRLELSSPPTAQAPALSQTELVSYLMFGRPTFSRQGTTGEENRSAAVQAGVSYLTSAFSSELQRTLISDLGVPIDYLEIRAGSTGLAGGQNATAQVAQVAAGWQIGRRWFVTLVADLCTNAQRFYPNAEFRMSRQLRLKTSVEPAHSCQLLLEQPALSVNEYQVGLDVLWEREY